MSAAPGELLIFGCGFLGLRVAKQWIAAGGTVRAITRPPAGSPLPPGEEPVPASAAPHKSAQLRALGITPVVADLMHPEELCKAVANHPIDRVLYCVGYDRSSPVSKESLYIDGLTSAIETLSGRARRFVYVSSSSVYGQDDGSWVDEDSPTEPDSDGGRTCLRAEQRLRDRLPDATILRMSGLYGPERLLVRLDQLRAGVPIGGNPEAWLNLIHGDDAAAACVAALQAPSPGPLYLVSDDQPLRRRDYFEVLARQIGAPPPVFSGEPTSRHSGTGLNKRCRNARVKRELDLSWKHPRVADATDLSPGHYRMS